MYYVLSYKEIVKEIKAIKGNNMSDIDVFGNDFGSQSINPDDPISETSGSESYNKQQAYSSDESDLENSNAEVEEEDIINLGMPILMPPMDHAIITHLLNEWSESIASIAEEKKDQAKEQAIHKEIINDRVLKKEELKDYIENLVGSNKVLYNFLDAYNDWLKISRVTNETSAMVSVIVICSGFSGGAGLTAALDAGGITINPISEAWNHGFQQFIPADMRAELGLIGAYYASLAASQLALVNPVFSPDTRSASKGEIDQEMSREFALLIVKKINSTEFNVVIASLIKKLSKAGGAVDASSDKEISPEDKNKMASIVKLSLLLNSFALVYLSEFGGVSAKEIADYIEGRGKTKGDEVKDLLLKEIKMQLAVAGSDQQALLSSFYSFIGTHPSLKDLIHPAKIFGELGDSIPISQSFWQTS